jgi:hypothetical protein
VNDERTSRHRLARVRLGDRRAAGLYEQCSDAPGEDRRVDLVSLLGALVGVDVGGLVGRPGHLDFSDLRSLASSDRLSDLAQREIAVADLFGRVQVAFDAEIVMITAVDGDEPALRVDSMLNDLSMCFELGTLVGDGTTDWRAPVRLVGENVPGGSISIRSLDFMTFDDFIGGRP